MLFNEVVAQVQEANVLIDIPDGWGQGRATFGGLVAAVVYQAMKQHVPADKQIRNLSISFIGPVEPGKLSIGTELLREGKGVSVIEGRGIQDGQVKVQMTGSFGAARDSNIVAAGAAMPVAPKPEECQRLPYIQGVTPDFTRHFRFEYGFGGLPFSNTQSREMGGWIMFTETMPAISEAELLGLIDAWPPATLPWASKPAPASTLTWNIQFLRPLPVLQPAERCLYQAYVEHASEGYGYTHSKLWSPRGELIALSQQTVTVFA